MDRKYKLGVREEEKSDSFQCWSNILFWILLIFSVMFSSIHTKAFVTIRKKRRKVGRNICHVCFNIRSLTHVSPW